MEISEDVDDMNLQKQNILFFTRGTQHGGAENVIVQLCKVLKPHVNKIVVCSAEGFRKELLEQMEIAFYPIQDIENKSPVVIRNVFKALQIILKKECITVIHTHHRMAAFYARILAICHKCVLINTAHSYFYDKKIITNIVYRNRINLIACGEKVKDNLVDFFKIKSDKIEVIHNAIEEFNENIKDDSTIQKLKKDGHFLIGNVSRLSKEKGVEYYIRAIPKVIKQHPEVRFLVIGSGDERDRLESIVKYLNVCDYVIFMGYRKDVQNIMSQLDLIVLSSLVEGFPLSPIEAFSVGKTIVATDVGGTTEIVKNGINGYIVPPKDHESLAKKINFLLENEEIRKQFEKVAKESYYKEFEFTTFERKTINYYLKISL